MRRLVALAAVALFFAFGSSALAHASYVRSTPAADARLTEAPSEVRITFSEPLELRFSEITVIDSQGSRVDHRALREIDPFTIAIALRSIGEGGYTVRWQTLSTVDGHPLSGAFAFTVGEAVLPQTAPSVTPAPSPVAAVGRAAAYLGIALLLGGGLAALTLLRIGRPQRAALQRLLVVGAGLTLAGTLLQLAARPEPLVFLTQTRLGNLAALRLVVAAGALVLRERRAAVVAGAVAAVTFSLQGHAAASEDPLQVLVDLVHLLSAAAWVGGLAALIVLSMGTRIEKRPLPAKDIALEVARFSRLASVAVVLLALSGVVLALWRLSDPRDLVGQGFGLALLAKSVFLGLALLLAARHRFLLLPLIERGRRKLQGVRELYTSSRFELGALGMALVITGVLTLLPPPRLSADGDFHVVGYDGWLRAELHAATLAPGPNRYVVRLSEGLGAPSEVRSVRLRLSLPSRGVEEQEVPMSPRGAAEHVAETAAAGVVGDWDVLVIVQREDGPESRIAFVLPLGTQP